MHDNLELLPLFSSTTLPRHLQKRRSIIFTLRQTMIGIWQHQSLYIDTSTTSIIHCIYTIRLNNLSLLSTGRLYQERQECGDYCTSCSADTVTRTRANIMTQTRFLTRGISASAAKNCAADDGYCIC
jgi:hypothetical protein